MFLKSFLTFARLLSLCTRCFNWPYIDSNSARRHFCASFLFSFLSRFFSIKIGSYWGCAIEVLSLNFESKLHCRKSWSTWLYGSMSTNYCWISPTFISSRLASFKSLACSSKYFFASSTVLSSILRNSKIASLALLRLISSAIFFQASTPCWRTSFSNVY